MTWRNHSLRRRLLVWLLGPLLAVCGGITLESYFSSWEFVNRAHDRTLLGSALAIAERVVVVDGDLEIDLPYVALEMLGSDGQDRVYYRVDGPDGAFITGYRDLPSSAAVIGGAFGPVFFDAEYRGEDVRVAALSRDITTRSLSGRFAVHVAETAAERNLMTRELLYRMATRLLILTAIASLIAWYGVGRGLVPLEELQRAIRRRSDHDLRPFSQEVPGEVRHLVGAINDLMARLGNSIASMQRFISDASHQLRTPLAAIRTQTEVALRERDPEAMREALERLRRITAQTSRLANQLLTLARAAPEAGRVEKPAVLDLAALTRKVAGDWVPAALERGIDLGFEGPDRPVRVYGNALMLRELAGNLVDNALKYCPSGARVTARVAQDGAAAVLEVDDDGPGISAGEQDRVFERFYRIVGSPADGCGLGLAIVREIAMGHGGTVTLTDGSQGKGLLVRVSLPALSD